MSGPARWLLLVGAGHSAVGQDRSLDGRFPIAWRWARDQVLATPRCPCAGCAGEEGQSANSSLPVRAAFTAAPFKATHYKSHSHTAGLLTPHLGWTILCIDTARHPTWGGGWLVLPLLLTRESTCWRRPEGRPTLVDRLDNAEATYRKEEPRTCCPSTRRKRRYG